MATQELLTVFLASPGDVAPERDMVVRIVEEYNTTVGEANSVRVQVVRWETDARPGWGKDGQAMINKLIETRDHALFVVIFWNRFGTPTPRANSGTLEEFNLAVKSHLKRKRPEIMLYFNMAPASLNSEKELDQRKAVLAFKANIKEGLYGTYRGKAAFGKTFRADYGKWLLEEIAALKKPRRAPKTKPDAAVKPTPKPRTPQTAPQKAAPKSKLQPILLDSDVFWAERVTERSAHWSVVLRPQDTTADRKIRALAAQNQWHKQFPLAYELQAGTAQPTQPGERSSDEKGAFWTLELRFTPVPINSIGAMSFNGVSSDEIATLRAKWLLLGDKPASPNPQQGWASGSDIWIGARDLGRGNDREPILPALWKRLGGNSAEFRPAARLWVVYRLLSSGTCEAISELKVGPVRNGKVAVSFRGQRPRIYSNQEPAEIIVKGQCALEI